ncbi:MAG: CoA-binding protein [Methanotrichaceae archaeon]|nr:CoA-binding protein [Methanotrichaceae archaeon]
MPEINALPLIMNDEDIRQILSTCKTVCVVGISPEPHKPSYFVSNKLKDLGFKLCLVNPKYAGQNILGERVYASIDEIPQEIDIVDVFRRPSAIPEVAKAAKEKGFKTFWMQPGTENMEVAGQLDYEGYNVVAKKCIKVESMRLL